MTHFVSPFSETAQFEPVFVARRPVFDAQEGVWGYELLFRHSDEEQGEDLGERPDPGRVISDGFLIARPGIDLNQKVLINFPPDLVADGAAFALPADICVIEILSPNTHGAADAELLKACRYLKEAGYTLAVSSAAPGDGQGELLGLADLIKVDVRGRGPEDLRAQIRELRALSDAMLLAERIESVQGFSLCKSLGFDLFQGFFFSHLEPDESRKLKARDATRLNLLNELGREDFDILELSRVVAADISLSYRLLRYINSAAFGLRFKIESIRQAIVMLGQRQLRRWLRVVVVQDLTPTTKARELAYISAKRARFLELLGKEMPRPVLASESMFMLGLFSHLDAILHRPMAELVADLPLEDLVKEALAGADNKAGGLLGMLESIERGKWEQITSALLGYGVAPRQAAQLHAQAMAWTDELFHLEAEPGSP